MINSPKQTLKISHNKDSYVEEIFLSQSNVKNNIRPSTNYLQRMRFNRKVHAPLLILILSGTLPFAFTPIQPYTDKFNPIFSP